MEQKKGSQAATYVAKYLRAQDDASSGEDLVKVDSLKFADFEPFMALFSYLQTGIISSRKQEYLHKGQCNIRKNPIMVDIIQKMFDFDLEVSELDNELFFVKEQMELIFNFMDLFFQLYDGQNDPMFASLLKKMNSLRRYYDKMLH